MIPKFVIANEERTQRRFLALVPINRGSSRRSASVGTRGTLTAAGSVEELMVFVSPLPGERDTIKCIAQTRSPLEITRKRAVCLPSINCLSLARRKCVRFYFSAERRKENKHNRICVNTYIREMREWDAFVVLIWHSVSAGSLFEGGLHVSCGSFKGACMLLFVSVKHILARAYSRNFEIVAFLTRKL